jgi:major membrane immunogen (membrane-anchored lipoprotein)
MLHHRSPTMRRTAILTIAALTMFLGACEKKSFADKYGALTTGMSQTDVERVLGKGTKQDIGGVSIGASGLAGGASANSQLTYIWQDGSKEITVTFKDGKVVNFNKAGF